ncbi:hypothetical protein [Oceanobacillus sp. CAU 1775]
MPSLFEFNHKLYAIWDEGVWNIDDRDMMSSIRIKEYLGDTEWKQAVNGSLNYDFYATASHANPIVIGDRLFVMW